MRIEALIQKLQVLQDVFGRDVHVYVGADDGSKVRTNGELNIKHSLDATKSSILVIR